MSNKFVAIRQFYRNLSLARIAADARDYVESYRHLREHGNAYSIIILEFILAPAVMAAKEPWHLAWSHLFGSVPPVLLDGCESPRGLSLRTRLNPQAPRENRPS